MKTNETGDFIIYYIMVTKTLLSLLEIKNIKIIIIIIIIIIPVVVGAIELIKKGIKEWKTHEKKSLGQLASMNYKR